MVIHTSEVSPISHFYHEAIRSIFHLNSLDNGRIDKISITVIRISGNFITTVIRGAETTANSLETSGMRTIPIPNPNTAINSSSEAGNSTIDERRIRRKLLSGEDSDDDSRSHGSLKCRHFCRRWKLRETERLIAAEE
uniref:Uncharacterized protein n=1 Tax=Opuntia streptacantha TaxID=393608 RepID=A0A7C9EVD8_OPUST